jgi:hypothetical protein
VSLIVWHTEALRHRNVSSKLFGILILPGVLACTVERNSGRKFDFGVTALTHQLVEALVPRNRANDRRGPEATNGQARSAFIVLTDQKGLT